MNNFSPNMLKTFEECQQKFFFKYVEKLSLPQRSLLFEKGKKIHALANYYLKGENIEKMEKTLTDDEKIAWERLKSNKFFQLNAVDTEYNLSCKIGNYWIGGRLDALMDEEEKGKREKEKAVHDSEHTAHSYFILDYKTGKIPQNPEQDFQTIVYLLCADKFLDGKGGYNSLKFVYLGLKDNIEKEILLIEQLKKEYEEKIISTCKKIDFAIDSNVFVRNNERCKNCEYNKLCD